MSLQYPVLYRSMDARADQAIAKAVATAIADAESLWTPEKFDGVFPVKGFGIRKLRPGDLMSNSGRQVSATSFTWLLSITTASTWSSWFSDAVLSDSCYCVITGIFNLDASPDVDAMKITADGVEYSVTDLTEMYGWDIATAMFSHPIVVRPEKTVKIEALARTAGLKTIGLLGYTIAKRSYLISTNL